MSQSQAKREKQRAQINPEELVERIERIFPEDGVQEVFPGFFLGRFRYLMLSLRRARQ